MMPLRIVLKDAFKTFTLDQDKVLAPEETVRRFRERLKQVDLDILAATERIDTGRLGIPVYFSRCGKDAAAVIGTKKQMGKGATPAQAEASAVMELAERFSFFSFCRQEGHFIHDTARNLPPDKVLGSDLIARSVHDDSADAAVARGIFESLPMRWAWGFSLTRQQAVLIPFDWFFAINEFNGPSAGNCVEEAISQGICEVVERHVSSLISRRQLSPPAIRPESASDPLVLEMLAKYRAAGVRLFLSDFTLEMGIPTVGVLAYDPATHPAKSEIVWTAGTTPDPQKALSRALTEVAQLAGDFNTSANYVASGLPKFSEIAAARFVTHPGREVDIQALPDLSDDNIRVEVENCVAALARRGMEVLVIDTTHPLLGIPSFYTIIPGAHFRERAEGTSVGMFAAKLLTEKLPPGQAIAALEDFDRKLPGKYYLKFYLGSCHLDLGDPQSALPCFEKALDLGPPPEEVASIYSYLGVCLKDLGRYREALRVLEKGERIDAERTDIFNLKGFCHFMLKEHREAIRNFERVLALNPGSAIDYANIGSNYRELGDIEEAIRHYEIALSLDPTIDFARDNLARLKAAG
jgi:ribosomal protein S12 methylthiotransferase accessory factor